jgi:transcriptional repressor NrdR
MVGAMRCPQCNHVEDKVLDTRVLKDGTAIRRRRECLNCRSRFSTQEGLLQDIPMVVKKDGRREPFSKPKLMAGLQAACQKRPVSLALIEQIVERVTRQVHERYEREIPSRMVGNLVMAELKNLDHVAYVRFASVYKTFKDVAEFVEELEKEVQA